ncbi:MAG TPA: hypothetical protein VES69_03575 [Pyrinomonadaceae bacterium]|nr:hypothetical protein [Pyrinomonadaceae bacterium]
MTTPSIIFRLATLVLQAALVLGLFSAGWLIYRRLPAHVANSAEEPASDTLIQLIMRPSPQMAGVALDVPVEFYPVDIVAVHHEYFTERRAGKRFDDFLTERMNGRRPVTARLDQSGRALVAVSPGNWWVHATLAGEEDLDWRLPVSIAGSKQTIELTPQNAYTRTKSF